MDKLIVDEGIETEEQLVLMKDLGCDEGQGYLFSNTRFPRMSLPGSWQMAIYSRRVSNAKRADRLNV